jgi:Zn-dependent protease with chaperone function
MQPPTWLGSILPLDAVTLMPATDSDLLVRFFDGCSSHPVPCRLELIPTATRGEVGLSLFFLPAGDNLASAAPAQPPRQFLPGQIQWPDAGHTRIALIRFADGSQVQSLEPERLAAALKAAGYRAPGLHALAEKMASHWVALACGVVACAAISAGVWMYGVPAASKVIARFMPTRWEAQLAETTLEALDKTWLKPSRLSAERQSQITAEFDALVKKAAPDGSAPHYRLLFRSMGSRDAQTKKDGEPSEASTSNPGRSGNAFALPGGVLVMTDELVAVAEPGAVLGVLAHELGHVKHRHATRVAVESSLLGTAVALISGDPTSMVAAIPVALASMSFSRSHEIEADCYAVRLLTLAGQNTEPLARLLETISTGQGSGMAGVLSSHPATPERVQLLRDPAAVRKACG